MKKHLIVLLLLVLLLPEHAGLAENRETTSPTFVRAEAEADTAGEYDGIVLQAIDALKDAWLEVYGKRANVYLMLSASFTGYLEIRNTRVIRIRENPHQIDETASESDIAADTFGNVDYLVEFIVFSEYMGSAPYYESTNMWDCVAVLRDGTFEAQGRNPLVQYRSRTGELDLSGIIEEIIDLGDEYNAVYHLLLENGGPTP